jgi:hypothetical protein
MTSREQDGGTVAENSCLRSIALERDKTPAKTLFFLARADPARGTSLRSLRELRLGEPISAGFVAMGRRLSRRSLWRRRTGSCSISNSMSQYSRGMFCPSSAQLLDPFLGKGAGKTGRRLAPMGLCAKKCTRNAQRKHRAAETTRPSLRSGLTAYAALSSVTNSFCHRRFADSRCIEHRLGRYTSAKAWL